MAQVTGGKTAFSHTAGGATISGNQHAVINYSIASSAAAITVTLSSIQEYIDNVSPSGSAYLNLNGVLSADGYSDSNYTVEHLMQTGSAATFASNRVFQWSRGTSQQTKTIKLSTNTKSIVGTSGNSVATLNVTIPALESWNVTYNANGGQGVPSGQLKYYNVNLTLSAVKPTKDGYKFIGWATSEANAKAGVINYAPGDTYSGNAALSLWAVWELAYTKPTINNLKVDRCKSDGTLDDEGTYALVTFDWAVYNTDAARYYGGNTYPYSNNGVSNCTITITDGTITKTATPTLIGTSGSGESVIVGDGSFDTDAQYSVTLSITDSQAVYNDKTTTVSGVLATSFFPMDINSDASALGFLMPAPDNASGVYFGADVKIALDVDGNADASHDATSGSDKDLFNAIRALGWYSDCIEE